MAFVGGSGLSCLGRSGSSIRRGTGCSATTGGSCWGECGGVLRAVRRWDKDWEEGVGAGPSGGGDSSGAGGVFFFFKYKIFCLLNKALVAFFFLLAHDLHLSTPHQPSP